MHSTMVKVQDILNDIDPVLSDTFRFNSNLSNLYFIYRWILLLWKREFPYHDLLQLWDVLISYKFKQEILVAICVSIILEYRDELMVSLSSTRFDQLLTVNCCFLSFIDCIVSFSFSLFLISIFYSSFFMGDHWKLKEFWINLINYCNC